MHPINSRSSRATIAAITLAIASLALAACGGSSSTSTTTATSTSSTATTPATGRRSFPGAARFAALRECLQKNGISLPQRTSGKRSAPGVRGLLGAGGGPALPKGVSRTRYEAVLKKCGGFAAGRFGAGRSRFGSPEAKKALVKFAACMRENGIKLGEPNTSGKGAIFDTKRIDTASAKFTAAEQKCRVNLRSALGARPGAGASPGAAPPAPGAGG
jgi:hypothetical protein